MTHSGAPLARKWRYDAGVSAAEQPPPFFATTLILLLIGASLIFTFGYRVAVNRRANSDYKKTKEGLPGMRKDFWRTLWAAIKIGIGLSIAFLVMTALTVAEAKGK